MNDLMRYASQLADEGETRGLPPIHLWDPPFCGDINMVIKRDGTWTYGGTPITRARLVRLFSTVLKREGEAYFLVTPVEKIGIQVEDAPFVAVLCDAQYDATGAQILTFTTNVGDSVIAGADHELVMRPEGADGIDVPYLHVRNGLEAKLARPVYYELADMGEVRTVNDVNQFGVMSSGQFFAFGPAADIIEADG